MKVRGPLSLFGILEQGICAGEPALPLCEIRLLIFRTYWKATSSPLLIVAHIGSTLHFLPLLYFFSLDRYSQSIACAGG